MRARHSLRISAVLLLLLSLRATPAAAAEPVRVATLLPFVEDALREAGGTVRIVGSVRRSLHEPTPPDVADLGNPHAPSLETLAASRPELVVGDAALHAALRPKIERLGARVVLLDTASVEATFDGLVDVGRRVGAAVEMQAAVDETRAAIAGTTLETPVSALVLFGAPGSFYAMTERTWLGDLMARLDFRNAAPASSGRERFPGLVALSDELVAGLSPQVVLLVAHGDPNAIRAALERRIEQGGAWQGLQRAASVQVLDPALFAANPGLRMSLAARQLVRLAPPPVATAP